MLSREALIDVGYAAKELRLAGVSAISFRKAGFSLQDLRQGYKRGTAHLSVHKSGSFGCKPFTPNRTNTTAPLCVEKVRRCGFSVETFLKVLCVSLPQAAWLVASFAGMAKSDSSYLSFKQKRGVTQ